MGGWGNISAMCLSWQVIDLDLILDIKEGLGSYFSASIGLNIICSLSGHFSQLCPPGRCSGTNYCRHIDYFRTISTY